MCGWSSTDCCPTTPTATVTKKAACPTCVTGCVIPTDTVTVTTGCGKATTTVSGGILTASATFVVG